MNKHVSVFVFSLENETSIQSDEKEYAFKRDGNYYDHMSVLSAGTRRSFPLIEVSLL